MSINSVTLMGRVGQDPQIRTAGQSKVAQFSLATGGKYTTKEGKEIDDTAWHSIVAWRNLAELAEKYIRKGSQILVIGRVTYRMYTGTDGVERKVTEIIADKIELCGAKDSAPSQSPAASPAPARPQYQTSPMPYPTETDESDLPFS